MAKLLIFRGGEEIWFIGDHQIGVLRKFAFPDSHFVKGLHGRGGQKETIGRVDLQVWKRFKDVHEVNFGSEAFFHLGVRQWADGTNTHKEG